MANKGTFVFTRIRHSSEEVKFKSVFDHFNKLLFAETLVALWDLPEIPTPVAAALSSTALMEILNVQ